MNFRENFKKDMKKCDHHIADLRKQLASRYASVEKVRGRGSRLVDSWGLLGQDRYHFVFVRWSGRESKEAPSIHVAGRSCYPRTLG